MKSVAVQVTPVFTTKDILLRGTVQHSVPLCTVTELLSLFLPFAILLECLLCLGSACLATLN